MTRRRHHAAALATGLLALAALAGLAAQPSVPEAKLKAAFVSKFPQFVTWPGAALEGRPRVDLCVAPPNPFGSDLEDLVAGDALNGRPIAVRRLESDDGVDGCQILYIPDRRASVRRLWLRRAGSRPVLTVGDTTEFLDDGGMVSLRVVDGRLRFDVNMPAVERAGLRLSAQLLGLAMTVRGR